MSCLMCASPNQTEFGTEILVHFHGLKNLNKPPVWVFPQLLVCLDCGFAGFTTPERELAILAGGPQRIEPHSLGGSNMSCSVAGAKFESEGGS
jgi:hypothetical protein